MKYLIRGIGIVTLAVACAAGITYLQEQLAAAHQPRTVVVVPQIDLNGLAAHLRGQSSCRHVEVSSADGKDVILATFADRGAIVSWLRDGLSARLGKSLSNDNAARLVADVPQRSGAIMAVTTIARRALPRFMADMGTASPVDVSVEYFEPVSPGAVAQGTGGARLVSVEQG